MAGHIGRQPSDALRDEGVIPIDWRRPLIGFHQRSVDVKQVRRSTIRTNAVNPLIRGQRVTPYPMMHTIAIEHLPTHRSGLGRSAPRPVDPDVPKVSAMHIKVTTGCGVGAEPE